MFQKLIFDQQCDLIIKNMFCEHNAKRASIYAMASSNDIYHSIFPAAVISMSGPCTISFWTFVGWASLGVGITGVLLVGALALFQRTERRKCQSKYVSNISDIVIDVEAIPI